MLQRGVTQPRLLFQMTAAAAAVVVVGVVVVPLAPLKAVLPA
jgi:hypothetical protein